MDAKVPSATSRLPDRQFYARSRAFGRFGMRIFAPQTMERPHWHGHVELNFARNCRMHYVVDGEAVIVEPEQLTVFWAGIPHQLTEIEKVGADEAELCNIYLPLDAFFYMPYIPELQVAVLTGGMIGVDSSLCNVSQLQRWYRDYRANSPERVDVVKMELNALFRRVCLEPFAFIRKPWRHKRGGAKLASVHVRHVVAMVRHVLDHLEKPLTNADVAKVTGLHTNYALSLFTKTMLIPLKQFIIRMRLLRARGLLLESNMAVSQVALLSGFGSASQFYQHFALAYGMTPMQLRDSVLRGNTG
jgi:AraC family transcriptional regulator, melibiose operon regulatory protein